MAVSSLRLSGRANQAGAAVTPPIPKTWDDDAVAALEVPLANAAYSPVHVRSDVYYQLPVRPVYKSYPIYAPDREPAGYIEWLRQQEPEIVFNASTLTTESDWIRAGELVFDAPIRSAPLSSRSVRDPDVYAKTKMPLTRDGVMPCQRYVIRKKGVIEVGDSSCAQCHTRVLGDGTVVKGAQGNYPGPQVTALALRRRVEMSSDAGAEILAQNHRAQRFNYGAPWIRPDPADEFVGSIDQLIESWDAIPTGVGPREGASRRYAPQVPDLIGVKDRRYLDHTGLVRQRSIGDLMRYAALNQDAQFLSRYGDFKPIDYRPPAAPVANSRYSDEQLYALSLYLYSLQPPPNPNPFDALARRGQHVFERTGCGRCHTPPLYTNNKLTPAEGFVVPDTHRQVYDVLPMPVGTDPGLALSTRRGTGYYKVPSLKGVWYRGPFEHNGSVATLEDWFDPARLRDDYVPTGFKGYGVKTRAVKGHSFGLDLSAEDRRALIAFLKTL
jgi:mono/diheme cytochrome c family protein